VGIVREPRGRRFRGTLDADVFAVIDLEATTRAYEEALRVNLVLRRAATRVRKLDPHLGDVARFVSLLLWRGERPAPAREGSPPLRSAHRARPAAEEEAEQIWQQILASAGPPR
jgi:hypothetical protein